MIAALIGSAWPFLVAGGGALIAIVATIFARKSVQTSRAQVAAAQSDAKAQVTTEQVAESQANATAAQAGGAAVKTRIDVENAVAAKPAGEVKNELDSWTR